MKYPIVQVKTRDNIYLYGLVSTPKKSDTLFINIHGTGSNFFCESFQKELFEKIEGINVDALFTNNRGSYALDSWQDTGAALEMFEDSILDIDAWIEWAKKAGYLKIILSGHSHGTEKVVYYMNKGKHITDIIAVVLMGFADSVGNQLNFEKTIDVNLMQEAQEKIANGKGYELLVGHRRAQAGELPISAQTYLNYFSINSELGKTLPFRENNTLPMIRAIKVPIFASIGDREEYTIIPIEDAVKLLIHENPHIEVHQIRNCNHSYEGCEHKLSELLTHFIQKLHV